MSVWWCWFPVMAEAVRNVSSPIRFRSVCCSKSVFPSFSQWGEILFEGHVFFLYLCFHNILRNSIIPNAVWKWKRDTHPQVNWFSSAKSASKLFNVGLETIHIMYVYFHTLTSKVMEFMKISFVRGAVVIIVIIWTWFKGPSI